MFCQNGRISHENFGKVITPAHLREIMEDLVSQGAHCIDLVTPTHFTPWVLEALEKPLGVPVVWNSGGYERVETLRTLEGKVQIYLPDLKYAMERPARELSAAPDYFAEDGQLWGNPLYDWAYHKRTNYAWWVRRVRHALSIYDILRIDHFRGFDTYWAIPAGDKNARGGKWEQGPGMDLFRALRTALGLSLIHI